jgi:dienelactone hydrolase
VLARTRRGGGTRAHMRWSNLSWLLLACVACGATSEATESSSEAETRRARAAIRFHDRDGRDATSLLLGEPFVVNVTGLTPGAIVTLRTDVRNGADGLRSEAVFTVPDSGTLALDRDAPTSGSYADADPDGILWSLVRVRDLRLDDLENGAVRVTALQSGEVVGEGTLARFLRDERLARTEVREQGLVGAYYAMPTSTTAQRPALLVFGGSEGGLAGPDAVAAHYASRGYPALALAYHKEPGLPDSITEIPLEYFERGLRWLASRDEVDASRMGVYGASRGGELALLLGATFPELVKSVVAKVPSGALWRSTAFTAEPRSAWSFRGVPLPFVPSAGTPPTIGRGPDGRPLYLFRPQFAASWARAGAAAKEAATIDVARIRGATLMLGGADDQVWPSCDFAAIAMDRLVRSGHAAAHHDTFICYPGAGHNMGFPGTPTTEASVVFHPAFNAWMGLGGKPQGIAHAQRDAYERIDAFLAAEL